MYVTLIATVLERGMILPSSTACQSDHNHSGTRCTNYSKLTALLLSQPVMSLADIFIKVTARKKSKLRINQVANGAFSSSLCNLEKLFSFQRIQHFCQKQKNPFF